METASCWGQTMRLIKYNEVSAIAGNSEKAFGIFTRELARETCHYTLHLVRN